MATAAYLPIVADRAGACVRTIRFVGIDLTGVALALQARLKPDTPGAPLFALTAAAAGTEGISLVTAAPEDGIPVSTIKIRIAAASMQDPTKVPYSGELGDASELAYDLVGTIGGDVQRLLFGEFVALPTVFGANNAPASRPEGNGNSGRAWSTWSGAEITLSNDGATVTIDNVELLAPLVSAAATYADASRGHANDASEAAAEAIAASNSSKLVTAPAMPVSISDSVGRVAEYVSPSGNKNFASVRAKKFNNIRMESLALGQRQNSAKLLSSMAFLPVIFQSLGATTFAGANITTTPAGHALLAPWDGGNPPSSSVNNPTANDFVEATTVAQGGYGESPIFALVNEPYHLLELENGLTPDRYALAMVSANNCYGGTSIVSNSKGSERYNRGTSQLTALRQRGINTGRTVVSFGRFGMGGENELSTNAAFAPTKTSVQTIARDIAADDRAILTGNDDVSVFQTFDPILFIDTPSAYAPGSNMRAATRAILAAAIDYFEGVIPSGFSAPPPVVHTTPVFSLGCPKDPTGVHPNAEGSHGAGAYGALALKRIFLDENDPDIPQNRRWPPMYFRLGSGKTRRVGTNTVILKVQRRAPQASLVRFSDAVSMYPDGTGIPEQQDYGFGLWDGSALRTLLVPEVVSPDEIAITVATGNLPSAYRVGAGLDHAASKMLMFTGGAVNARDNYGDYVQSSIGRPLHGFLSVQGVVGDSFGTFTRF